MGPMLPVREKMSTIRLTAVMRSPTSDGLEILPLAAAVEQPLVGEVRGQVFQALGAGCPQESGRGNNAAEAGAPRGYFVVPERVGVADGFGEGANVALLNVQEFRQAFLPNVVAPEGFDVGGNFCHCFSPLVI